MNNICSVDMTLEELIFAIDNDISLLIEKMNGVSPVRAPDNPEIIGAIDALLDTVQYLWLLIDTHQELMEFEQASIIRSNVFGYVNTIIVEAFKSTSLIEIYGKLTKDANKFLFGSVAVSQLAVSAPKLAVEFILDLAKFINTSNLYCDNIDTQLRTYLAGSARDILHSTISLSKQAHETLELISYGVHGAPEKVKEYFLQENFYQSILEKPESDVLAILNDVSAELLLRPINEGQFKGLLPLQLASYRGYLKVTQSILQKLSSEQQKQAIEFQVGCSEPSAIFIMQIDEGLYFPSINNRYEYINGYVGIYEVYYRGWSALHFAIINGHTDVCDLLLKSMQGVVSSESRFYQLWHAVFLAIQLKKTDIAKSVIDAIPNEMLFRSMDQGAGNGVCLISVTAEHSEKEINCHLVKKLTDDELTREFIIHYDASSHEQCLITPMIMYLVNGHREAFEMTMKRLSYREVSAPISQGTMAGKNALYVAMINYQEERSNEMRRTLKELIYELILKQRSVKVIDKHGPTRVLRIVTEQLFASYKAEKLKDKLEQLKKITENYPELCWSISVNDYRELIVLEVRSYLKKTIEGKNIVVKDEKVREVLSNLFRGAFGDNSVDKRSASKKYLYEEFGTVCVSPEMLGELKQAFDEAMAVMFNSAYQAKRAKQAKAMRRVDAVKLVPVVTNKPVINILKRPVIEPESKAEVKNATMQKPASETSHERRTRLQLQRAEKKRQAKLDRKRKKVKDKSSKLLRVITVDDTSSSSSTLTESNLSPSNSSGNDSSDGELVFITNNSGTSESYASLLPELMEAVGINECELRCSDVEHSDSSSSIGSPSSSSSTFSSISPPPGLSQAPSSSAKIQRKSSPLSASAAEFVPATIKRDKILDFLPIGLVEELELTDADVPSFPSPR